MPWRKLLLATVLSLPLISILVLPDGSLDRSFSKLELILLTPLALEYLAFLAVCKFSEDQSHFSQQEQNLLLLLAVGIFLVLGLPLTLLYLTDPELGISAWQFVLLMGYGLSSLIINVRRVAASRKLIHRYFTRRFVWPGIAALALTMLAFKFTGMEINAVATYFIIKNYIFALGD